MLRKIVIILIVLALLGGIYYFFIYQKMASSSQGISQNGAGNSLDGSGNGQGVALPVKSLRIFSSQDTVQQFEVEVADNDDTRGRGLMYRTALDENKGMLFIFPKMGIQHFWMKNTLIPLDMVFIDDQRVIVHIAKNATPCLKERCDIYSSVKSAQYVLEINGGLADKLQLKEGDRVNWD